MIQYQNKSTYNVVNQEKLIYKHLRDILEKNTEEEILLEFKLIFFEGKSKNPVIKETLRNIIASKINEEKYFYILNYCIHIIINFWFDSEVGQAYILKILDLFENIENQTKSYNRYKQKLVALSKLFVTSQHYSRLRRVATVISVDRSREFNGSLLLKNLAPRYTYLYPSVLLGKESIENVSEFIYELQANRSKSFEFKLAQHVIYRSRLIEIARAKQFSQGAGKVIRRVANPTLLSDKDLRISLKQYIKKLDGGLTLAQTARKFKLDNKQNISYLEFKKNLYAYLIANLKPRNSKYNFQDELGQFLNSAYYQSDSLPINNSLILRTCRKLFQILVVNNVEKNQHHTLMKIIHSLGTAKTAMLLVKIVLICPQAKTDLENKIGILFTHYENKSIEEVPWLAKFLENFLVAFSIYFGKLDISLSKTI